MDDLQPTLTGDLIRLRPLRADDFERLHACASDPLIWEQHPQPTRYQREVFRKYFDSGLESRGALVVIDRAAGEIAGSSRYYDHSPDGRRITIGYTFLARRYWGKGFNRELKELMLDHAFRLVDKVYFEIGENNLRSRRAIEKLGARLVETQVFEGKRKVIYAIGSEFAERSGITRS
jgi:hypothetical protein